MESDQQRLGQPPVASRSAAAHLWPDLAGIHAFLVEDNEDTRAMVTETLQHCGAVVTVFDSADAAMAHLRQFAPTVLICDLSMPGLNGLDFLRAIRRLPEERGGNIPALAITAYYEEYAAAKALEVGFDVYMIKPVRLDQLCRAVKELADSRRR
jgi:CheY-like chemotaxis protein